MCGIMDGIHDIVAKLGQLPARKWNIHERVMCRWIGLREKEGLSVRQQLSTILAILKNGGVGSVTKLTWQGTGYDAIDLNDTSLPNMLGIHYIEHGAVEYFPASSLSMHNKGVKHRPRYFSFGEDHVPMSIQTKLVNCVTGNSAHLGLEARLRRQRTWKGWFCKDAAPFNEFNSCDLRDIAHKFGSVCGWNTQNELDGSSLHTIAKDIREVLMFSNKVGVSSLESHTLHNFEMPMQHIPRENNPCDPDGTNSSESATDSEPDSEDDHQCAARCLPWSLKLASLTADCEHVMKELASIEFMIHNLFICQYSLQDFPTLLLEAGIDAPCSIKASKFVLLSKRLKHLAWKNVQCARSKLLSQLPFGLFQPKDKELLCFWIKDGR